MPRRGAPTPRTKAPPKFSASRAGRPKAAAPHLTVKGAAKWARARYRLRHQIFCRPCLPSRTFRYPQLVRRRVREFDIRILPSTKSRSNVKFKSPTRVNKLLWFFMISTFALKSAPSGCKGRNRTTSSPDLGIMRKRPKRGSGNGLGLQRIVGAGSRQKQRIFNELSHDA